MSLINSRLCKVEINYAIFFSMISGNIICKNSERWRVVFTYAQAAEFHLTFVRWELHNCLICKIPVSTIKLSQ